MGELKARIARRNEVRDPATPEVDPSSLDEWATMFEPPDDDELGGADARMLQSRESLS